MKRFYDALIFQAQNLEWVGLLNHTDTNKIERIINDARKRVSVQRITKKSKEWLKEFAEKSTRKAIQEQDGRWEQEYNGINIQ